MSKSYPVTHSDAEWRKILTPEQYDVMRGHGTEAPGSCALLLEKRPGHFTCAGCGTTLFETKRKFESGTGWPSFDEPIARHHRGVGRSHASAWCGRGALRRAAPPGTRLRRRPAADHQRYCINGVAMSFVPDKADQ